MRILEWCSKGEPQKMTMSYIPSGCRLFFKYIGIGFYCSRITVFFSNQLSFVRYFPPLDSSMCAGLVQSSTLQLYLVLVFFSCCSCCYRCVHSYIYTCESIYGSSVIAVFHGRCMSRRRNGAQKHGHWVKGADRILCSPTNARSLGSFRSECTMRARCVCTMVMCKGHKRQLGR